VVLYEVSTGRASSTPRAKTTPDTAGRSRCGAGHFVDDDGRWRSAHRLSTTFLAQCRTARGLFAARREQRSPTVLSDAVAVLSPSTPTRLRLADVAAALMTETRAVATRRVLIGCKSCQ
jgi:hypothetical protein